MESLLGSYSKSPGVYKCPGDPGNPVGTARVRSISMNGYMNGKGGGTVAGFENFMKTGDLQRPAQWFVFLDEKPATINDEYFEVFNGRCDDDFSRGPGQSLSSPQQRLRLRLLGWTRGVA
jgi:hypothetical protein